MNISLQWLSQHTRPEIMRRGESLLKTSYPRIHISDALIKAEVQGTRAYEVKIKEEGGAPEATCTCPYDQGGFCKHIVAVVLLVLKSDQTEFSTQTSRGLSSEMEMAMKPNFFQELFLETDHTIQNRFLEMLFRKQPALRMQFVRFLEDPSIPESSEEIDRVKNEIHQACSGLTLDITDINPGYDFGYRNPISWPDRELTRRYLMPIFSGHSLRIDQFLNAGQIVEAMEILLGIYEGIQDVGEPEYPVESIFPNFESELLKMVEPMFLDAAHLIRSEHQRVSVIDAAIDTFFNRMLDQRQVSIEGGQGAAYDFAYWEAILKSLSLTPKSATHLHAWLQKSGIDQELSTFWLIHHLGVVLENDELWTVPAKRFMTEQPMIAKALLKYELAHDNKSNALEVAKKTVQLFPVELEEEVVRGFDPSDDPTFYEEVLIAYMLRTEDLEFLPQLPSKMNEQVVERLSEKINRMISAKFYVEVLLSANRMEALKDFVGQADESHWKQILPLVAPHFPTDTLAWVSWYVQRELGFARGRKKYVELISWMVFAANNGGLVQEMKALADHLRTSNPALKALHDELSKAGF
ncbi:SWIM zinc finger family protein [Pontibacter sp. G13]|uniref:SWIM zinc finger family protein n=1 Tax=Pontibacter sp. G13 TaxID=3074898 RepID=UPI00288AF089|nr:SWIM zinc finger family protein [Pontibacter sp. G13]WNJ21347.1 SWIM zinc finger family protein [Pontibacter sp. G13]